MFYKVFGCIHACILHVLSVRPTRGMNVPGQLKELVWVFSFISEISTKLFTSYLNKQHRSFSRKTQQEDVLTIAPFTKAINYHKKKLLCKGEFSSQT